MKYICRDCEDGPCTLEIAKKADRIPDTCPWDLIADQGKAIGWKEIDKSAAKNKTIPI